MDIGDPQHYLTGSASTRESNPYASTISKASSLQKNATWICSICSLPNPLPSNFDVATASVYTPLPPCLACGIKPTLAHVLKAVISSASGRHSSTSLTPASSPPHVERHTIYDKPSGTDNSSRPLQNNSELIPSGAGFQCARCTFQNHPQLLSCEICGASLLSAANPLKATLVESGNRPESPGPTLDNASSTLDGIFDCVKLSFRAGGDKIFYERLKSAMIQRKWLLSNAPPVPKPGQSLGDIRGVGSMYDSTVPTTPDRSNVVGIAGLERRGQEQRKNNEVVIGSAFEDFEALMASAKEIVALAESFARTSADRTSETDSMLIESAAALSMITTKDMLGTNAGSESLYLSELSRNLAEYLTDDARGVLKKEGGIMSLVDLWAVFNRARGGADLVNPSEFVKAAQLWEKLGLPVRLRQFKNGLLVVQRHDWTDAKTMAQLSAWLQELHERAPYDDVTWDWATYGRGVTAQDAAQRFGWSIGVASEELEMAEEKGLLCREGGVEGLRFWENHLVDESTPEFSQDSGPSDDGQVVLRNLEEMGLW